MDYVDDGAREEKLDKYDTPEGIVTRWLKELDTVEESKQHRKFIKDGETIVRRYKNTIEGGDADGIGKIMYNILWANVQVLNPTLFCRLPQTVVERIHKDADPIGRVACMIAERAVNFNMSVQEERFMTAYGGAVLDRLLPGIGTVWFRYDCEWDDMMDENGEPVVDEEGNPIREPRPNTERAIPDPLMWQDYLQSAARNRYEVRWVARKVYMTRAELVKRFGKIGNDVDLTLNVSAKKRGINDDEDTNFLSQAEIYEIWDKPSKKVFHISRGLKERTLETRDDPLRLDGFFPCPGPLLATTTTDSMYPTPDFKIYERLADELDYVTKRLSSMVESVRLVGIAAGTLATEIKSMLELDDGQLKGIKNWQQFMDKGGLEGAVYWWPFEKAVAAIPVLSQYKIELKQDIFDIEGIADIVRGASDPSETLGAQQMKGKATSVRTATSQADVQRMCKEGTKITAQIIFEPGLFSDETIALMCSYEQWEPEDQELFMPALEILRNDRMQTFRVSVATDSTIWVDEDLEQQRWQRYMQTMQGLVGELQSVTSFAPELLHPMVEAARASVRSLRTGRNVEGAFDKAWAAIEKKKAQAAAQPPPPPPPNPDMLRAQAEQQRVQNQAQESRMKGQIEQGKMSIEQQRLQLDGQKMQMDFEIESKKVEVEYAKIGSRQEIDQMDLELKQFAEQFSQTIESGRLEVEKYKVTLDEKEKFLEEIRLQQQEKVNAEAEVRRASDKKSPPVHINLHTDQPVNMTQKTPMRAQRHSMRRTPDGLVGESIDVPHPSETQNQTPTAEIVG